MGRFIISLAAFTPIIGAKHPRRFITCFPLGHEAAIKKDCRSCHERDWDLLTCIGTLILSKALLICYLPTILRTPYLDSVPGLPLVSLITSSCVLTPES